jgi:hypothetical protein
MRSMTLSMILLCGCSPEAVHGIPLDLRDTGLYASDGTVDASNRAFTPGWEAWSDGAEKTRWIHLPAGARIDDSDPNAWSFPVGTKLWKEFRVDGKKIETRLQWKDSPTHWSLAAYVWSDDQQHATLTNVPVNPVPGSSYEVPAGQCEQCHQSGERPLGFSSVMLSAPGAAGLTVAQLAAEGLIASGAPASPPLGSASAVERDAVGYLHANCGAACHRPGGSAPFSMRIELLADGSAPQLASDTAAFQAINHASGYTPPGGSGRYYRLRPTDEEHSTIFVRMSARTPGDQMPPLGSHAVDEDGRAALAAWINAMTGPSYPAPAPLQ